MSDAFWIALFAMLGPAIPITVSHFLNRNNLKKTAGEIKSGIQAVDAKVVETKEQVDHNVELSNSMLSKTKEEKDEAERKLQQIKADELTIAKTKIAELEKQLALLIKPGDSKQGG